MQKLLSLPPNLVSAFYELENVDRTEWFCTSDPVGMKLGSGGGTTWLLREWYKNRKWNTRRRNVSCSMPEGRAGVYRGMRLRERS